LGGTASNSEGPARWQHYIETPDLDATTEEAIGLGATVQTPPVTLPNGGRYALLSDPQGAAFALISSASPGPSPKAPKRGEFSWMELATTDVKAAMAFYGHLFGWTISKEHDMGPLGFYYLLAFQGRDFGGAYIKPEDMPGPPSWLGYVRVKSVDNAVNVARKVGGTLLNGPMQVPGGDWIAQLLDPQGAMFAVHMLASDAKPAAAQAPATAQAPAIQVPDKIEVTGMPTADNATVAAATPSRKKAVRKTQSKPKAKARPKAAAVPKRKSVKSLKRSTRKAVKVRSKTSRLKAKAAPKRKKTAVKPKKRAGARARKSK
jgi:predicted enzyme related to lactoylglutathione lyase